MWETSKQNDETNCQTRKDCRFNAMQYIVTSSIHYAYNYQGIYIYSTAPSPYQRIRLAVEIH